MLIKYIGEMVKCAGYKTKLSLLCKLAGLAT